MAFPSSVISYGGRLGYQTERQDDSYIDELGTPQMVGSWNVNIGATWTMDYYQMFKK